MEPSTHATGGWRIELLGWLRAVGEGRVVSRFRSQQTGALLAYLAFYRHRSHPRDALVELLWPECDWDAGRNRFRVALSSLRHQLEPPGVPAGAVLIADRSSLQLNPAITSTDVSQFEAALQAADRCGSSMERVQRLGEAVTLYRGELLPGYFEPWILPERQRLSEVFLNAVAELIAHHQTSGDLPGALQWARRAVSADPLREESHRDLIRLLAASGQPDAALRQYEELTAILTRELGEEPSAETRTLAAGISTREPEPVTQGRSIPSPVAVEVPKPSDRGQSRPHRPAGTVTLLLIEVDPGREGAPVTPQAGGADTGSPHPAAASAVPADNCSRLRATLREHGGEELPTPGGTLTMAYSRASDAVAAAQAVALQARTAPAQTSVRMAIHTGEVEPGEAHGGRTLQQATHMLLAAHPSQTLVSQATAALVRNRLPGAAQLIDLGLYHLGGAEPSLLTDGPERLYQLACSENAPRFPPPRARPACPARLPYQFTRLFGREAEIAQLQALLGAEDQKPDTHHPSPSAPLAPRAPGPPPSAAAYRLLTLTGPGGTGKTRLALAVAEQVQERFGGRVWSVPLADLTAARQIPGKILEALTLPRSPDLDPLDQVVEALSDGFAPQGGRSLLLLDNFEQLVEDGTQLVQSLLERVAGLTLLVTSRRLLNLPAEREFAVAPLPVPVGSGGHRRGYPPKGGWTVVEAVSSDTASPPSKLSTDHWSLTAVPSVALFVDRAQAVRPDFQITSANAEAVAHLCARLEGIPLALELAAARARILTPAQMLARLQPRLDLLVSRGRAVEPRHHSLRAALEWSYQLLDPELQRFFASLSVFRGGWTLEAAEAVCGQAGVGRWALGVGRSEPSPNTQHPTSNTQHPAPSAQHPSPVLEYLEQLLESSLVFQEPPPEGEDPEEPRFRFLETVREYAAEQLPAEERAALCRRHSVYYRTLAETAEMELLGANQTRWLARLDLEHDNIRAALDWAEESGEVEEGLRLAGTLWGFWWLRGTMVEGRRRLERLLEREEAARGAFLAARERSVSGAAVGEALGSPDAGVRAARARALACSGVLAHFQGEYDTARAFYEESLAIQRELGDRWGVAFALTGLGFLAQRRGDLTVARDLQGAGLPLWRELGIESGIAWSLNSMADVAHQQGDLETARSLFEESLAIRRKVGDDWGAAFALSGLGLVAADQGDLEAAQTLLEESLTIRHQMGDRPDIALSLQQLGELARLRGDQEAERARLEECLAIQREIGNRAGLAMSLMSLAHLALMQGETGKPRQLLEEALQIQHEIDHRPGIAAALYLLGRVALRDRRWNEARERFQQSLRLRHELGEPAGVADCLEALAGLDGASGAAPRAARLFGAAQALREALGVPVRSSLQADYEAWVASARDRIDAARWAAAWAEGSGWDLEQAVAAALLSRENP
jgi:predicted ATPase/DNA-binding SARP family transcriptional activator